MKIIHRRAESAVACNGIDAQLGRLGERVAAALPLKADEK